MGDDKPQDVARYPTACYLVGVLLPVILCCAAVSAVCVHLGCPRLLCSSVLLKAHAMCALFGMIGATLAAIRKYYRALISESTSLRNGAVGSRTDWSLGWVYYYLTRPLLGATLGALSFTLSYVGVQVLTKGEGMQIADHGRYLLFGLAFVSGFAVSHVLDRLDAVAKQAFRASSGEV